MQMQRFGIDGQAFSPQQTAAALGSQHWQRLLQIDQLRAGGRAPTFDPATAASGFFETYDVALVGGGLSLMLAPLLARSGLRVVVIERTRAAWVHREWNASAGELEVLIAAGLLTPHELEALVLNHYRTGSCAWYGHDITYVPGVLDCAVDAGSLMRVMRERAEQAGVRFIDNAVVEHEQGHKEHVDIRVRTATLGTGTVRARAMVDGRGAHSPYAKPDLLCPTVGGVFSDLSQGEGRQQWRADVGEILATTSDLRDGHQYLWEAFPGRPGELTVYLFAYMRPKDVGAQPLAKLYERFWQWLPEFKLGTPRLLRPTYGIIPGWTRRGRGAQSPHRRIVLVGDAAARHSPLTFCGFGAMLRSLKPAWQAVRHVCDDARGPVPLAVADTPLHSATGALAAMIAEPPADHPGALNALLDAAFSTLAGMGKQAYADLLQDRMQPAQMVQFLWRTSRRHPQVWQQVRRNMGALQALQWSSTLAAQALQQRWRERG